MTGKSGQMRQTTTAEVRLDGGKAASSGPGAAKSPVVLAANGSGRSNFVAARLAETESRALRPGYPGNVGGNAFARFMLAGLGQIRIGADVLLIDPANGHAVGKFEVSKDFAFGGIYGAATRPEDVEDGFARSVAAIFKQT